MSPQKKNYSLSGKPFLPARIAAQKLSCAPDYVGKLCREGKLDCARVDGAWLVDEASIAAFEKSRTHAKLARAQELSELRQQESLLRRKMLSTRHAAKALGCAPDYIGKLCREGKLNGVRVRNAWFVTEESLAEFEAGRDYSKAVRAQELRDMRRSEIEEYRGIEEYAQQEYVAPYTPRKVHTPSPFFSTKGIAFSFGVLFLLSSVVFAAGGFANTSVVGQNVRHMAAALAQLESPFFGTHPVAIEFKPESAEPRPSLFGRLFTFLFEPAAPKYANTLPEPVRTTPATTNQPPATAQTTINNNTTNNYTTNNNNTNHVTNNTYNNSSYTIAAATPDGTFVTKEFFDKSVERIFDVIADHDGGGGSLGVITDADVPDDITASNYLALSGGTLSGALNNNASGTSTFAGGLAVASLNVTGVGTSTFANGIDIDGGCFSVNGACITGGGTPGGSNGQIQFNNGGTFAGSSSLTFDSGTGQLGFSTAVGTSATTTSFFSSTSSSTNLFTSNLSIGSLTGLLQANNGLVTSSSTLSVAYGGTGTSTAPNYGTLLVGNGFGGYDFFATSSLGITPVWGNIGGTLSNQTDLQTALDAKLSLSAWFATTTDVLDEGLTNLYFTNARARGALSGTSVISYDNTTGVITTTGGTFGSGSYTFPSNMTVNGNSSLGTVTSGIWNGSAIGPTFGGTGITTVTQNQLLIGGAGNTWTQVGTSSLNIALADTTGTLSVARGGTGSTTLGGLLIGAGSTIESATVSSPLSLSGSTLSILQSGIAQNGYLSSVDWAIFNNKISSTSLDTSAELAALLTDETGSGSAVFATDARLSSTTLLTNTLLTNATSTTFNTGLLGVGGSQYFTSLLGTGLTNTSGVLNVSLSAFSTTNLSEGSNLYYTDARVGSYISGSSTIPHVGGSAYGDSLYWTGTGWVNAATSSLGIAISDTTGTLSATRGGTGLSSFVTGDILYADSNATLTRLPVGSAGQVLKVQAGLPAWGVDQTIGGGGSDGIFATSSGKIYPLDTASVVLIGTDATSTANSIFEVSGQQYISTRLAVATTSPSTGAALAIGGSGYFTGGLGVGVLNTNAGTLQTSGSANIGGSLTLGSALSVQYGGTGSTTLTGLLVGNGTGSLLSATVSSPLTFSGSTLSIQNAAADGSTKGAASFTAADFDATSGNISIDYTNGQAASGSNKGFLTSADWTLFNNKISSSSLAQIFPFTPTTFGSTAANATSTLIGFSNGIYALASSTIGGGTQITGLTISGGATTTGNAYVAGNLTVAGSATVGQLASDNYFGQGDVFEFNADGSGAIIFKTNSVERFYIPSTGAGAGNVGIGTTTPGQKLSVAGDILGNRIIGSNFISTSTAASTFAGVITSTATAANTFPYASTTAISVSGTGYFGTATTTALNVSGTATFQSLASTLLSTNSSGAAQSTTVSGPLAFSGSTLSITQANASTNGYLSSTDWSVFNNKISSTSLSGGTGISYNSTTGVISATNAFPFTTTTFGSASANATSTLIGFNSGIYALASSTIGGGTQITGLTISGGATTTGNAYVGGSARFGSTLTLANTLSCTGNQALQTNSSGDVSCGTISVSGASTGGGWSTNNTGSVILATTSDRVGIGATSTPYAKLSILSGATGTTTLALLPFAGQTANILDIYNTSGALSSVFTATGRLGLGTTSPSQTLSVQGGALFSGDVALANLTATGTASVAGNFGVGTTSPYSKLSIAGGNITHIASGSPALAANVSGNITYFAYVSGNYVYMADDSGGLRIVDITNPKSPSVAGSYTGISSARSVVVAGQYAYVDDSSTGLNILDVSNAASPTLVGTYAAGRAFTMALSGQYLYVPDILSGVMRIINVSNPAAPTLAGSYTTGGSPYAVAVSGKYAYLGDQGTNSIYVLDVSNPTSPSLVSTYTTGVSSPASIQISGKYAYVSDTTNGFYILDISNPASLAAVGSYSAAAYAAAEVAGGYAYLANNVGGSVVVLDVTRPATPTLVGTYASATAPRGIAVAGKYVFVADSAGGLKVLDINGIEAPSASIGAIHTDILNVSDNVNIGGNVYAGGGLTVGLSGIFSRGGLASFGSSTLATTTISTLNLTGLNGPLQAVNGRVSATSTISVAYGGTGSTTLTGLLVGNGTGSLLSATVSGPLAFSGSTLSITQANASTNGYLSSTDWSVFNNKVSSSSLAQIFPFTPTTNYGAAANSTSTPIWFTNGLMASSTSRFGTTGQFTIDSTGIFAAAAGTSTLGDTASGSSGSTLSILGPINSADSGKLGLYEANSNFGIELVYSGATNGWALQRRNGSGVAPVALMSGDKDGDTVSFGSGGTVAIAGNLTVASTTATSTFGTGGFTIGTNRFLVQQGSGNVGIGTTSPGQKLSVAGDILGNRIIGSNFISTSTAASIFPYASTTALTVSGSAYFTALTGSVLATDSTGKIIATTSIGVNNLTGILPVANGGTGSTTLSGILVGNGTGSLLSATVSGPLAFSGSTLSITQANASTNGYLSSTDWSLFNNKISSTSLSGGTGISYNSTTGVISSTVAYPFALTGNATSTLTQFNGGLTAFASSTIGAGTQTTGLTISGGATTTGNAYFLASTSIGTPVQSNAIFTVSGNTAPLQPPPANTLIHFGSGDGVNGRVVHDSYDATPNYIYRRANGTAAAPSAVLSGDSIGTLASYGYGATAYTTTSRASISMIAAENWTDSAQGMYITFSTTDSGTAVSPTQRMRITDAGNVGIGTTSPGQKLSVAGDILGNRIIGSNFIATSTTATSTFAAAITVGAGQGTSTFAGGLSTTRLNVTSGTSTFANGTNLTAGCYAIGGTCLSLSTISGTLGVANGGTGSTTLSGILVGNGTSAIQTLTVSSPLTFSGSTLSIQNAAADGSTKGAASFTAADFDATSGNISIDYTNGQAASGSNKGFLTSADWTLFNNKISSTSLSGGTGISYNSTTGVISSTVAYPFALTGNATSTLTQFNGGLTAFASSTIGNGTAAGGLTISGTATTTNLVATALTSGRVPYITTNGAFTDSANLTFNGSSVFTLSGSTAPSFQVTPSSGSAYIFGANTAAVGAGIYDATAAAWRLLVKDTTGNVGIGTTTPGQKLSVAGDILGNRIIGSNFISTSTTASTFAGIITSTATAANTFPYASSTALSVSGTGYFGTANVSGLTASRLVATDANKNLASTITLANLVSSVSDVSGSTGTTNLVLSASPTFTGTANFASIGVSGNSTLGTVTSGIWNGSAIGGTYGGTGLTSVTQGSVLIGSTGNTWTQTATSSLGIAISDTTGTLAVARGGTGATTLTGLLIGNGTSAMTGTTLSSGISGQLSDETGSGSLVFSASPTFTGAVRIDGSVALGGSFSSSTLGVDQGFSAEFISVSSTSVPYMDWKNWASEDYDFRTQFDPIQNRFEFHSSTTNNVLSINPSNVTIPFASTTALSVAGNAYFANNGIWDSSGNVGIGTSTVPGSAVLALAGNAHLTGKITASSTAPTFVGSIAATGSLDAVEGIAVQGNYIYTASFGGADAFTVIDATDPSNLVIIASTTLGADSGDVIVNGKYAYVAVSGSDSLKVIDISNPTNPTIVGNLTSATQFDLVENIYLSGKYIYAASTVDDMLSIIDISDPTKPTFVGSVASLNTDLNDVRDVVVQGRYAYLAVRVGSDSAVSGSHLSVVDVSNPTAPVLLSSTASTTSMWDTRGLTVSGRYAYMASLVGDALTIYDISNPLSPTLVGSLSDTLLNGAYYVEVRGKYAYVSATTRDSVTVVDVSNPASPFIVASYTSSTEADAIAHFALSGRYLYLTAPTDDMITVLDIGSELPSLFVGDLAAGNLAIQNLAAFGSDVTIGGGLTLGGSLSNIGGISSYYTSTSTTAANDFGGSFVLNHTGVVTTGTDNTYGVFSSTTRTGATGGTINTYGGYFKAFGDTAGAGTSNVVGLYATASGGDNNYAALFDQGNVGIGTTTPGSLLSLGGIANFTAATSTFYGTGGLNLAGGCYAIGGTCLTVGSFGGTLAIANGGTNATTQTTNGVNYFNGTSITSGTDFNYNGTNVGIGSTSPSKKLTVLGSSVSSAIGQAPVRIGVTTASSVGLELGTYGGAFAMLQGITHTTNATGMVLLNPFGGSVGVATTTSNNYTFSVTGTNYVTGNAVFGSSVGIGTTTPWAQLSINPNGITGPAFAIGSSTGGTNFVVTNGGRVGIGTTSPSALFNVFSTTAVSGLFERNTAADVALQFKNTVDSTYLGINSEGNFAIGTTPNLTTGPSFVVDTGTGYVGIGTSTPSTHLSVLGSGWITSGLNVGGSPTAGLGQIISSGDAIFGGEITVSGVNASTFAGVITSTATSYNTFPYASTTALTVSGDAYFDNASGIWNSSGRVGIGTLTPDGALSVSGTVVTGSPTVAGMHFGVESGTYNALESYNTSGTILDFSSASGRDFDFRLLFNPASNVFNFQSSTTASVLSIGTSKVTIPYASTTALSVSGASYFTGTMTAGAANFSDVITSTATAANTFPYASSTALTVSGNSYFGTNSGTVTMGATTTSRSALTILTGTTNDSGGIKVIGASASSANLASIELVGQRSDNNTSGTFSGTAALAHARSDSAIVNSGQVLGRLAFGGNADAAGYSSLSYTASIAGITDSTVSSSSAFPTALAFYTGIAGTTLGTANVHIGTERMRVDSDGNVGIGDSTPTYKLDVTGNARFTSLVDASNFVATSTTATSTFAAAITVGAGQGTSTFAGGLSTTRLNVTSGTSTFANGTNLTAGCYAIGGTCLPTNATLAQSFPFTTTTNFGATANSTSTPIWFVNGLQASSTARLTYASTTALTVSGDAYFPGSGIWNSSGSVGIGTTNPASKLEVSGGNIEVSGSVSPSIILDATSGSDYVFGSNTSAVGAGIYDSTASLWRLLVKDTTGNVGIGTTSPGQKLSVAGDILGNNMIGSYFTSTSTTASTFAGNIDANSGLDVAGADITAATGVQIDFADEVGDKLNLYSSTYGIGISASETNWWSGGVWSWRTSSRTGTEVMNLSAAGALQLDGTLDVDGVTASTFAGVITSTATAANTFPYASTTALTVSGDAYFDNGTGIWNSSGNVGIGTTSPTWDLSVVGGIAAYPTSNAASSIVGAVSTDYDSSFQTVFLRYRDSGVTSTRIDNILNADLAELAFQNATNALISTNGQTPIILATFAHEALRIQGGSTNQGFIGIASTSPFARLSVHGNANDTAIAKTLFAVGSSTASATTTLFSISNVGAVTANGTLAISGAITSTATSYNTFPYASTTALTVSGDAYFDNGTGIWNSSGDVGIGTLSPDQKLHVYGNILAASTASAVSTVRNSGVQLWTDEAFGMELHSGQGGSQSSGWATALYGRSADTVALRFGAYAGSATAQSAFSEKMTLLNNGNFGIGTTSPTQELSVTGDGYFTGQVFGNQSDTVSAPSFSWLGDENTGLFHPTTNSMGFVTAGTEKIRIDASGNLGIGTTTPVSALNVAALVNPKITITDTNATADTKHWFMENMNGEFNIGTTSDALATNASYRAFTIETTGEVGIGTANPAALLDVGGDSYNASNLIDVTGTYNAVSSAANVIDLSPTINMGINSTITLQRQRTVVNPTVDLTGAIYGNYSDITLNSGSNAVADVGNYVAGLVLGASYSGTVAELRGYQYADINDGGSGVVTNQVGLVMVELTGATNNTSIMVGNANLQDGNWGIFAQTDYPNLFEASTTAATNIPLAIRSARAAVVAGTNLGNLGWMSNDTNFVAASTTMDASIGAEASGTHTTLTKPTDLVFRTSIAGNIATNTEKMRVTGGGNVGIGTTSPLAKLSVHANNGETNRMLFAVGSSTASATTTIFSVGNTGNVRIGYGSLCVDNNDTCTGATTAGTVYAVGAYTTGADLAEQYPTIDETLSPGEIVSFDIYNNVHVVRAEGEASFLGVISTAPGVLLNGYNSEFGSDSLLVPVALAGRVPVKVSLEGGVIGVGDRLMLSSTPGVAKKATESGQTIGVALEPYTSSTASSTILVFIDPQYTFGQDVLEVLHEIVAASGTDSTVESPATSTAQVFTSIILQTLSQLGVTIENGVARFMDIFADHITTNTLTVGSTERPAGITLFDKMTGEPYCFEVVHGEGVTTPGECVVGGAAEPEAPVPPPQEDTTGPDTDNASSTLPTTDSDTTEGSGSAPAEEGAPSDETTPTDTTTDTTSDAPASTGDTSADTGSATDTSGAAADSNPSTDSSSSNGAADSSTDSSSDSSSSAGSSDSSSSSDTSSSSTDSGSSDSSSSDSSSSSSDSSTSSAPASE